MDMLDERYHSSEYNELGERRIQNRCSPSCEKKCMMCLCISNLVIIFGLCVSLWYVIATYQKC